MMISIKFPIKNAGELSDVIEAERLLRTFRTQSWEAFVNRVNRKDPRTKAQVMYAIHDLIEFARALETPVEVTPDSQ